MLCSSMHSTDDDGILTRTVVWVPTYIISLPKSYVTDDVKFGGVLFHVYFEGAANKYNTIFNDSLDVFAFELLALSKRTKITK